jgi:hypothetical protein
VYVGGPGRRFLELSGRKKPALLTPSNNLVLGQALDRKGPDCLCVFITDLPVFLVLLRIAPSLKLFQAVAFSDNNAAFWRGASI